MMFRLYFITFALRQFQNADEVHTVKAVYAERLKVAFKRLQSTSPVRKADADTRNTTCRRKYIDALVRAFIPDNSADRKRFARSWGATMECDAAATTLSTKEMLYGIGPGSTGTLSLFLALSLLGIQGLHYKAVFANCAYFNIDHPDYATAKASVVSRQTPAPLLSGWLKKYCDDDVTVV